MDEVPRLDHRIQLVRNASLQTLPLNPDPGTDQEAITATNIRIDAGTARLKA